jgi:hypothetical protein
MGLLRRWSMLLLAAAALPTHAADPDYYGGVMLGVTTYDEYGVGFDMTSFTGRLGYQVSRSFALEARLAAASPGQGSGANSAYTYRVDALGSVLAKFSWQPSKDAEAYLHALLGVTAARTTTSSPTAFDQKNNLHGGSIGLGLDLFADRTSAINIEWIQYLRGTVAGSSNNTYTVSNFGIGYLQRF